MNYSTVTETKGGYYVTSARVNLGPFSEETAREIANALNTAYDEGNDEGFDVGYDKGYNEAKSNVYEEN